MFFMTYSVPSSSQNSKPSTLERKKRTYCCALRSDRQASRLHSMCTGSLLACSGISEMGLERGEGKREKLHLGPLQQWRSEMRGANFVGTEWAERGPIASISAGWPEKKEISHFERRRGLVDHLQY